MTVYSSEAQWNGDMNFMLFICTVVIVARQFIARKAIDRFSVVALVVAG